MTIAPWKILESSYLRPYFRLDQCELPNGKMLEAFILEFRPWANVLALTKDNKAVLIKQYRHGVQEVLWELPGGIVDDNETPMEGVQLLFRWESFIPTLPFKMKRCIASLQWMPKRWRVNALMMEKILKYTWLIWMN